MIYGVSYLGKQQTVVMRSRALLIYSTRMHTRLITVLLKHDQISFQCNYICLSQHNINNQLSVTEKKKQQKTHYTHIISGLLLASRAEMRIILLAGVCMKFSQQDTLN